LCRPQDKAQLKTVLGWARQEGRPVIVLSGGTNVLVSDEGVKGVVVLLREGFDRLRYYPLVRDWVRAGAGVKTARLVGLAAREGWAGLAFLAGVPGTIGGAAATGASTKDGSMDQVITRLDVIDPAGQDLALLAGGQEYARWRLNPASSRIVIEVEMKFGLRDEPKEVARRIRAALRRRRQTQPRGQGSAGCFFKNPADDFAGRLIEAAGLKGLRIGDAQVSPLHANFIVNLGQATAADVLALAERIQAEVKERFGRELAPEVDMIGFEEGRWPTRPHNSV
ncbi:MAG: UDP-N-acetylmuramate dehydrogenase, partial [Deltaproteobacteria bacterium]|nr:UDP-N-acetylmuramate dehydrogenase [Deltaproteobacteria bacterium]